MALPYESLDPRASEIRLLVLAPGASSAPISCTLITISLDYPPKYAALSYVWGDETDKKEILLSGRRHSVTANLDAALRRVRHATQPSSLWVDALCINQMNLAEKNVQVPLMSRIYSEAFLVIVWLGDSTPGIEKVAAWIQQLGALSLLSTWLKLYLRPSLSRKKTVQRLQEAWLTSRAYGDLMNKAYWTRMWTFQEFRLARGEPILLCGDLKFWPRQISISEAVINRVCSSLYAKVSTYKNLPGLVPSDELMNFMAALSTIPELGTNLNVMGAKRDLENDTVLAHGDSLTRLLLNTFHRKCQDPRDHVYSLYGMIASDKMNVPPLDYKKSVDKVMHETAIYLLREENGLKSVLLFYALHEDRLQSNSKPSWVPDFTQASIESESSNQYYCSRDISEHLAMEDLPRVAGLSPSFQALHVSGYSLGPCNIVVQFEKGVEKIAKQLMKVLESTDELMHLFKEPQSRYTSRQHWQDTLTRAIVAHSLQVMSTKELKENLRLICSRHSKPVNLKYVQGLMATAMDGTAPETPLDLVLRGLQGKTLIEAKKQIGITVADVQEGDEVVVSTHFLRPIVLRANGRQVVDSAREHRLVGFAYVDGLMDDEGADVQLIQKVAMQEVKQFNIV